MCTSSVLLLSVFCSCRLFGSCFNPLIIFIPRRLLLSDATVLCPCCPYSLLPDKNWHDRNVVCLSLNIVLEHWGCGLSFCSLLFFLFFLLITCYLPWEMYFCLLDFSSASWSENILIGFGIKWRSVPLKFLAYAFSRDQCSLSPKQITLLNWFFLGTRKH